MVSIVDRVTQAYNAAGLFENTLVQVDELPKLSSSAKLISEIFPSCKIFAISCNGDIVKKFFVPSASIPYPKSVIAALSASPARTDLAAILNAIENFDDDNVSTLLGVESEDFRLAIGYRSEFVNSRLTHYPRSVAEREIVVGEFINFMTCEIQVWIVDQVDVSPGPIFVLENFSNTDLKVRNYPLIKDVLTLLATSSCNKVMREMASQVGQESPEPDSAGWGGIRKRRPVQKQPENTGMSGRRIIDQTIVMHEIDILYGKMKSTILSVSKSFVGRKFLQGLSFFASKKSVSSLSTRAPPSMDFWPSAPLATAELEHKIRLLSSELEERSATIVSLKQTIQSREFMIAELSNHLVHLKAQVFAYADEIEEGVAETDLATLWTELEKLKIENKLISSESGTSFRIHQELRKRDEIIDLLNLVIVKICGTNPSDEVRFAEEKIHRLMRGDREIQSTRL
jgi:hypothetical protein